MTVTMVAGGRRLRALYDLRTVGHALVDRDPRSLLVSLSPSARIVDGVPRYHFVSHQ
jgi:hypothetical protein